MICDPKDLERFYAKTKLIVPWPETETLTACLDWLGSLGKGGQKKYGSFWFQGKNVLAHRWIYENDPLRGRALCPGDTVDHLCRKPSCVNVEHLFAVSSRENTLRSNNPAAMNARKSHCVNGHAFSVGNTIAHPKGWRKCRECCLERDRKRRNGFNG